MTDIKIKEQIHQKLFDLEVYLTFNGYCGKDLEWDWVDDMFDEIDRLRAGRDKLKEQYDEILAIATNQADTSIIIKERLRKHQENHDTVCVADVLAWFDELDGE